MSDDIDIDNDGFDSFDDFDAPDFDGEVGGGNETRTPITAAASSFTEAATSNLLSVNAAQRVLRKGLPEGYGEAADLVDEVAFEASDLYDKAEKRLEPAIKSTKEATRALLPKAEGILPKSVYEKLTSWSEDRSQGGTVNADEESISTTLSSIFTTQMEKTEQDKQEQNVQSALNTAVEGQRHEKSVNQMAMVQQSLSRLVGYQDNITAAYQKKSLDLQFRHYFAARDLLKLQTASNADVVTALNDIKTNTGLPDWVKTQNSENFQAMLQERLMGGTVESVSDYMGNFREKLVQGVKTKALDTVGEVSDGIAEVTGGITQLTEAQAMMDEFGDGPKEDGKTQASGIAGNIAGGSVANWITNLVGGALSKEGSKRKVVVEKGLELSNMVRGADGQLKEFIDTADQREGILGTLGSFLQDAAPRMNTDAKVLSNLSERATDHVEWDLLSRRTLVEIIPEYLARITQNTESMATGQPAEKMVYSKLSESFVSEADAIAEATDKFVMREEINEYRQQNQKLLDKLFGSAKISEEARDVMSEQIHTDLSRGWNMDPRRYVEPNSFEERHDIKAVDELQEFFREKYKAKNVGELGKEDWELNLSEQNLKQIGGLMQSGRNLQAAIPNVQDSINEFVGTGDKDLLRASGWIDSTSGTDKFNQERMTGLMTGRLSLDDLQSEWDRDQLRDERKQDVTKWRDRDAGEWQLGERPQTVAQPERTVAEVSRTPEVMSGKDSDILASLNRVMSQTGVDSTAMLARLDGLVSGNTESFAINSQQLEVLKEIREILVTKQSESISVGNVVTGGAEESPGMMKNLGSKLFDLGKSGASALGSYYSTLGNLAGSGLGFAKEQASNLMGFVSSKKDTVDVFIAGLKTPALRAEFIKAGRYVDVATGKVITKLEDITGEVKDLASGNIVISAEDFENGIFSGDGESLLGRLGGAAKGLISGGAGMLGDYYGFLWNTGKKVLGGIKEQAINLNRKLKVQCDVYVKSRMEDGPVLLRTKLLRGGYFDIDGNRIFSVADITGPVYDEDQNMVLSDEDISEGLVNPQGEKIDVAGILGNGVGMIGSGIGLAKAAGGKLWDALKGYYSGIGSAGKSLLDKLTGGFGGVTVGGEDVDTVNITANNVYLTGNIVQSPAEKAGTANPTASTTADDIGEQIKNTASNVRDRAEESINSAASKATEMADKAVSKVKDIDTSRVEATIHTAKEKVGKAKDSLLGQELGEDTILVGDAQGNVSIKSDAGKMPAGDGTTNGYLASLLAYFHGRDARDADDLDGDGLRDGGWRSKLFGKKDDTEEEEGSKKPEGNRNAGKGILGTLAGALGLGGGEGDDGDSLMGDIASEAAGEVIGDKISGNGKDRDDGDRRSRSKGPKPKGRMGRAWQAIKGAGSKVKDIAGGMKGKGLIGGTAAGITGVGGAISGMGGSVATKMAATSGLKKAALWGLKGALGLVGGILGAPIVGTALAIAGAAYTAYEVFGFFSDRAGVEPLEEYRYRQYGLDVEDSSHRSFLRKLEDEAIDHINYRGQDGTENTLDIKDFEFHEDMMALVNIDPDVPESEDPVNAQRFAAYINWFKNRFRPVFLLHHGIAKMKDDDVDLLDIDDEMDDEHKADFVERAYYPNDGSGHSPYMVSDSPMEEHTATVGYGEIDELKASLIAEYKVDPAKDKSGGSFLSKLAKGAMALTPAGAAIAAAKAFNEESADGKPKSLTDKVSSAALAMVPGAAIIKGAMTDNPDEQTVANNPIEPDGIDVPNPEVAVKAGTEATAKPPLSDGTAVKRNLEANKARGKKGFVVPSDGRISSPYGNRVHPITGDSKFHTGIDIAAPTGTDVYASQGGTITRRGYSRSYGNVVYIDNDDGTHSRYAHLNRFEPGYAVGDRIEQGAKLAELGSTGWSTGPHLHFEVRKKANDKNSALDPLELFKGQGGKEARAQVDSAMAIAKVEQDQDESEAILEGEETILSTMKGSREVTHDQKRAEQARINTPLVKPSLMTPTSVEALEPEDAKDVIADTAIDTVVATPRPSINMAPITPVRKVPEKEAVVEVEVLQQRRAQIGQEDANNRNAQQLDAIGMLMSEQLKTQKSMELILGEIANNTKATAESIDNLPQVEVSTETKKSTQSSRNQPALTGNQLTAMMKGKDAKPISYPLLMSRNK